MRITGCDISHWNDDAMFRTLLANDTPFFFMKATEGRTYVDKKFRVRASEVKAKGCGLGLYHYARPENNTPEKEAEHFIKTVALYEDTVIALDWEGAAEKYPADWILDWCSKVEAELGRKPMLYLNHAYASKADKILSRFPLWCAKWGDEPTGAIGCWDKYTIWQYTNTPYDSDIFNGTIYDFEQIGKPKEIAEEIGHYCGCCCW